MSRITQKPVFGGLQPCKTQTGMLSSFQFSKNRYYTIQAANNEGADQTVLICAFVVRICHKTDFLMV